MSKNIASFSVENLKDALKDQPVLIVGSGPSADLDKEALQHLSSKVFTIAAGSSVQFLFSNGICPDLIVTLDGSEKITKYLVACNIPIFHCFMEHMYTIRSLKIKVNRYFM